MPRADLGSLVRRDGAFDRNQVRAGLRYFLVPGIRARLVAEIRAQFEAFNATGLALDHVNAHKHMHLHPTVARLLVEIGRDYGMAAVRLPSEPAAVLRAAFPNERYRTPAYQMAVAALRRRLRRAGLAANDHVFGIAWSGGMVEERILRLLPHLPPGNNEIYFHPADRTSPALAAAMPGYRHTGELAALLSPEVRQRVADLGINLIGYSDLERAR